MLKKIRRRFFLSQLLFLSVGACQPTQTTSPGKGKLTVGVINYGGNSDIINRFARFRRYLADKTKTRVELEPTFNENKALERIQARAWSLVFAPPGLAAVAIANDQYVPLFPLVGVNNVRSIIIVRKDSQLNELKQLQGQTLALGQPGSATGYYLPLYNLYGLTLGEVQFAPTPKAVLEAVAQGKAAAGAVSLAEFNTYSLQFNQDEFRILYTDPHYVPSGSVLIGPNVERNRQKYIFKLMREFPSSLAVEVGYVPNAPAPDYKYMTAVVRRVAPIAGNLNQKPVRIF